VNAVTIDISCPSYDGDVDITSGLYQVMKVNREELAEKHFKINVEQKGEPAEGYYVYEKTVNTILRVSGPKSKIDSIAELVVDVDVTDVSGSFATKEIPKAIDADGNEIDASNLTFSENVVSVNIGMYKTKKIKLNITTTGTPADGYVMTGVAEYEPKTVEVAGSDEALNNIDELNVEESIEGATQNIKEQIDLQEQLEEGLILVGDSQTAVVNVTIEKAETKEITIWPGDIDVRNKSELQNLTYLTTGPIVITVSGPAEEVMNISRDSLKPYIDLSDYSNGTYTVIIGVSLDEHTTLKYSPQVNIQLLS
jgi:YbbR domain-containing protein